MLTSKVERFLFYLLIAYFAVSFSLFIYRAVIVIAYPYELSGGEGIQLYESIQIIQGKQIYNDINARPYMVANYPPLYQLVCSAGILLTGQQTLFFGRLISVLSTFGIAVLLYLIILKVTKSRLAGIFSILIFFSFWYVYEWSPMHRVDMLGLFSGLLGLYWVQLYAGSNKLYWSIVFFALSIFTKQSLIFAPMSAAIFLLLKDKKKALFFSSGLIFIVAVIFITITLKTKGQFLSHLYISFMGGFDNETAFNWIRDFVVTYPIYLCLAGYSLYRHFRERKINQYAIYYILSFIPALGAGKTGAYANYYLELCITTSILAGLTWDYFIKHNNPKIRLTVLFLLCYQMNSLTSISLQTFSIARKPDWTHTPAKNDFDEGKKLVEEISKCPGAGFSEADTVYLLLAGKDIEYHPFLPEYLPKWKPDAFLKDLDSGRYQFFLSEDYSGKKQTPQLQKYLRTKSEIVSRRYKIKDKIGQYYIYVLKSNFYHSRKL